ncbi:MAG: hypothetical protein JNM56_38565 [Planctomycetia bacterium]|nr:hypothetical protein [Planctomycetia bacterium]
MLVGDSWGKMLRLGVLCGTVCLLAGLGQVRAGDGQADVIAEMKARLEALERQNFELMKRLEGGAAPIAVRTEAAEGGAEPADPASVRKIVGDYLKEIDTQKKKADEAKKLVDEQEGFTVGKDLSMTARWNHGLMLETKDKAFRIHPVGRLQVDWVGVSASDSFQFGPGGTGEIQDGVDFRRARVGVEGTMWEVFNFWFEPDVMNTFATPATGVRNPFFMPANTDMWFEYDKLPTLGTIRAGSLKPAISMEHITSSRFLDYMERSLMFDCFVGGLDNGFQVGLLQYRTFLEQRVGIMNSLTKNTSSVVGSNIGDGEYSWSTRIWGQPYWEHDGRCFMHLGLAVQHRSLDDHLYRYRSRIALRNGPAALHTPLLDLSVAGEGQTMLCPEFVVVNGPFSIHAEYLACWHSDAITDFERPLGPNTPLNVNVNTAPNLGTYFTQGGFVSVMYFLTGEHKAYDRRQGIWTRIVPHENFFHVRDGDGNGLFGRGAWQIGARYSFVDLEDTLVNGGTMHSLVLGLNWFTNPNMKWQFNLGIDRRQVPVGTDGWVRTLGVGHRLDF